MSNKDNSFFDKVFDVARKVPCGKVTTYGAIARYIGMSKSARMVGWALNKCNSEAEYVPAHRVVNRIGLLTGKHYFGGQNTMAELLVAEGIEIVDNKIIKFETHFWDPNKELSSYQC